RRGLAVDDPLHFDAPIGPTIGIAAGKDDRLRDGRAGREYVQTGIADLALDPELHRFWHVDDVLVLDLHVAPPVLDVVAVDDDRIGCFLSSPCAALDTNLVCRALARRPGERQRLEEAPRRSRERDAAGRADGADDHHVARFELV